MTADDVFFYVYGALHSLVYRQRFASELRRSVARIPILEDTRGSLTSEWPRRPDDQPRGHGFAAEAFEDVYAAIDRIAELAPRVGELDTGALDELEQRNVEAHGEYAIAAWELRDKIRARRTALAAPPADDDAIAQLPDAAESHVDEDGPADGGDEQLQDGSGAGVVDANADRCGRQK